MALRVGHHDDDAFVVLVPFASRLPTEGTYELDSLVHVVDGDIEMDPNLAHLRLCNGLEDEPRLRITAMAQIDPPFLRGTRFATEQRSPELCYSLRVEAVESYAGPDIWHSATIRPIF
jgi:hypothetical protein